MDPVVFALAWSFMGDGHIYSVEQEKIRRNSDGEKLRYVGGGLWIPEGFELADKVETKREMPRPEINVLKTVFSIVYLTGTNLVITFFLNRYLTGINVLKLFILLMLVCVFTNFKKIVVFAILLYQRFAPNEIRSSCLFVPSCSNYTIIALEKYGLIIGSIKAIGRLFRCHYPNGGEDYP